MNFSTVLFDLDGTLVDTNHLIVTSFRHTLKENLGLDVPAAELYTYFGEPLTMTLARFSPERALELTEFYRTYMLANHDELIRQFVGVREMVAELHTAGVKLGVVTSKRHAVARRGLAVSGLEPYFHTVVGLDDTEKHKPDAEPALLALRQLGETPGRHVLMVGDSRFDILCGKNAGLQTAAVGWTVLARDSIGEPDYWIEKPAEVVTLALGR